MSRDCCVALPGGAMGLSAVCERVFPDHTHLPFFKDGQYWINRYPYPLPIGGGGEGGRAGCLYLQY